MFVIPKTNDQLIQCQAFLKEVEKFWCRDFREEIDERVSKVRIFKQLIFGSHERKISQIFPKASVLG